MLEGKSCKVRVVLDSISPDGKRLISIEGTYWRAIHSEIMTHRALARNAASSRAIPFYRVKGGQVVQNCTFNKMMEEPFFPHYLAAEQSGMQSGETLDDVTKRQIYNIIEEMKNFSLEKCKQLFDLKLHKSIINRYLEPWSMITTIMSATEWEGFFKQRVHPAAEKHFNELATLMKVAMAQSSPTLLKIGQWHMPYLRDDDYLFELCLEDLKRISAARCARLSYLTHDGIRDHKEDLRLYGDLVSGDVIHASPLEHVATPIGDLTSEDCMKCASRSGPFIGWKQFRKEHKGG